MYADGIWHPWVKAALGEIRHGELVVIGDSGLPDDNGALRVIDLAFARGIPCFTDILTGVANELVFEGVTYAEETDDNDGVDPAVREAIHALADRIPEEQRGDKVNSIPHEQFKDLAYTARVLIRTGEATPYANVILHGGVPF